jgi:hypothetical protein
MEKLELFRIRTATTFGLGHFDIKAKSFEDAFLRLGKKDKLKATSIYNLDTDEEMLIEEILGIPFEI